MSTGAEGQVTGDGGTRCFGADVSTACVTSVARAFMVVATDGECRDGTPYPFKAIVFDDRKAIAVRCITAADAARLRAGYDAGTADVRELSPDDIAAVSTIITCPPVQAPGGASIEDALDIQQRLDRLTAWAQPLFEASLAEAPARAPAA
jgi:hypothetical protein